MRFLVIDSGASHSTKDVEIGIMEALKEAGHDLRLYSLEHRLGVAARWNQAIWKMRGKPEDQRPNWADHAYRASIECLEMALRFEVDWVLVIAGRYFHPDAAWMMRKAGVKVSILLTESPYEDEGQCIIAQQMDFVWTNERSSVPFLKQFNKNVAYSPHAYRPAIHRQYTADELEGFPEYDVYFVGTGFKERLELFEQINWAGINLRIVGLWTMLPSRHWLRQYLVNNFMVNEEVAKSYSRAKVGINLHRTSKVYNKKSPRIDYAESLNPRAYELAACGAFYLSDRRKEGDEVFGKSILTFESPKELEELIRVTLDDEGMRKRLAEEAMEKVDPYTFDYKVQQMIWDLKGYSNGS